MVTHFACPENCQALLRLRNQEQPPPTEREGDFQRRGFRPVVDHPPQYYDTAELTHPPKSFPNRTICDELINKFNGLNLNEKNHHLLLQVRYADTVAQKRLKKEQQQQQVPSPPVPVHPRSVVTARALQQ